MSTRPAQQVDHHVQLAAELDNMRDQAIAMNATTAAATNEVVLSNEMASLSDTERSAASLGVHPDAFRPISFLNTAHYQSLLKNNAIDGRLAQQLESYKLVSGGVAA
jgi:hypothetical protein